MALSDEDLIQITEHVSLIKNKTNIGIIVCKTPSGAQEAYFIDTGNDAATALEELSLAQRVFGSLQVRAIITTHSHADHCGGNVALKTLTGCEIWAPKGEAALMEVPVLQSSLVYGGSPLPEIKSPYLMAEPCAVDSFLPYDTLIQLDDDVSITACALPGHYIDMAAIIVHDKAADKKIAFLADGISGRNVIKRYWIQYLYDEGLFKQSLEKIRALKADFYIPGHGDPVPEIEGLVELNQIAVLETEAMILDELEKPRTFEELLKAVADRNNIQLKISQYELIGSTLRSYLSNLYAEGKISYAIQENRRFWVKAPKNGGI